MKQVVFTFIFLGVVFGCFAKDKNKQQKKDSNVEKIKSTFLVSPFYINENNAFTFSSRDFKSESIIYKPNIQDNLGLTLGYKGIILSYAFKLPANDVNGDTKLTRFAIDYQGKILGLSFLYNKYKGFYLKNPDDFSIIQENAIRSDITQSSVHFHTQFTFNKKFSINAAFKQNEKQKKSAGSFIFQVGDNFYNTKADSSFIPYSECQYFDKTVDIRKMKVNSIRLSPAYGYTFVFKHNISITSILLTSLDLQLSVFTDSNGSNTLHVGLPLFIQSRNALGYNGKYYFANIVYNYTLNRIYMKDSKTNLTAGYIKLSVGRRFGLIGDCK